jgi:hypothetical protein
MVGPFYFLHRKKTDMFLALLGQQLTGFIGLAECGTNSHGCSVVTEPLF